MSLRKFTTLPVAAMSPADFRSRCAAAAKLAMRGANYDAEDRADCAAKIAADVLGNGRQNMRGTAADVLRFIDWGLSHPATVAAMLAEDVAAIPAAAASFSRLYGMAANYRRGLDRQRSRDAADAARRAETDGFLPHVPAEDPAYRGTPWGARRTAVEMLRALGMLGRVVESGPVWTAAYAAARAAAGLDAPEIAAELDISYDTYRAHLSRAAKRFPSSAWAGIPEHSDALSIPEGGRAVKAAYSRTHSADLEADWRTRPDNAAPVSVRVGETRDALSLSIRPSWTLDLPHATAARLHCAADLKRARMAAKTAADSARDRLAAGLPATVR